MHTRSWTWLLNLTKLLACLTLVTLLWGCGTPYVIMPSASELPSSLQMQMEAEREALPDELRGLLKKTLAMEMCRTGAEQRPDPRLVGQTSTNPFFNWELRLLGATAKWVLEVSRDPSPKRLEHRKKLGLPDPATLPPLPAIDPEKPFWDEDRKEYTKGFVFGATSGAVPLAPSAIEVGIEIKLLPKGTYWARVGRACGELAVGTGQIILGCAGIGVGAGMSGTGGGAPAAVVVVSGSIPLLANGCVTAWHGAKDLVQLAREGEPPTNETSPAQPAPQPQPAPVAAKPPQIEAPPPGTAVVTKHASGTTSRVVRKPDPGKPPQKITKTITTELDEAGRIKSTTTATSTSTKTFTNPPPGVHKIRNMHLAGKKHPVTGVPFDMDGYPDFRAAGVVKKEVKIKFTGDRYKDRKEANRVAQMAHEPDGYTWHHHQDGETMQLIPTKIHEQTGHSGGFASGKGKP